ncbi:unnamed protein product [Boreogadus saida]
MATFSFMAVMMAVSLAAVLLNDGSEAAPAERAECGGVPERDASTLTAADHLAVALRGRLRRRFPQFLSRAGEITEFTELRGRTRDNGLVSKLSEWTSENLAASRHANSQC